MRRGRIEAQKMVSLFTLRNPGISKHLLGQKNFVADSYLQDQSNRNWEEG